MSWELNCFKGKTGIKNAATGADETTIIYDWASLLSGRRRNVSRTLSSRLPVRSSVSFAVIYKETMRTTILKRLLMNLFLVVVADAYSFLVFLSLFPPLSLRLRDDGTEL